MKEPSCHGEVLGVRLFGPKALEGDFVFGFFTGTARFVDHILFAMLLDFGFAELKAQSTGVHGPHVPI